MYQKLMIVGRLGNDPVMRYTPTGRAVTSFSVATGRSWIDSSGQKHDNTVWFRVSAWEKLAETCNQYLKKGRMVMVEGELEEPRAYKTKDDEWKASMTVIARQVVFLGEKTQTTTSETSSDKQEDFLEEIPF
ncbi:MAG: single-stranded DNA-binding protein [Dehalococcoidales bacterium]|nr:single-stranded DNA-binding protein [Dehalococcoidales bacterium]